MTDNLNEQEEHTNRGNFRAGLEERARLLTRNLDSVIWDTSITSTIEREIALVLNHIDRMRVIQEKQRRSLLQVEVYTDTELMQMEQRTPRYAWQRFPEREKLQRRLLRIEEERRRLVEAHEEKFQSLHDRLLLLMQKHEMLRM